MNPAERHLAMLKQQLLDREADLRRRGWRFLAVAHGDLERREHVEAVQYIGRVARLHPSYQGVQGGGDYTVYKFLGPAADQAVSNTQAVAEEHNPGWWKVTPTMQPDFGGR
jgi:hypothetical protein